MQLHDVGCSPAILRLGRSAIRQDVKTFTADPTTAMATATATTAIATAAAATAAVRAQLLDLA